MPPMFLLPRLPPLILWVFLAGKASSPAYKNGIDQHVHQACPWIIRFAYVFIWYSHNRKHGEEKYKSSIAFLYLWLFLFFSPYRLVVSVFAFAVPRGLVLTNHNRSLLGSQLPSVQIITQLPHSLPCFLSFCLRSDGFCSSHGPVLLLPHLPCY